MILFNEKTGASTTSAKSTHAVDIFAFVEAQEIPSDYFETPYLLAPAPGGERLYTILRETLQRTRKIGIAYVVIQARPHLAALLPQGEGLVLSTLRWASEENGLDPLAHELDEEDDIFHLGENEYVTAERLADSMSGIWGSAQSIYDSSTVTYGGEELQLGGEDTDEDEDDMGPGAEMMLDDTAGEGNGDFEDGYLAWILQRNPHRLAAGRSSRGTRGTAHVPRIQHASAAPRRTAAMAPKINRQRMRMRRH